MSKGPIALMTAVAITSTAAAGYFGYKNASIESRIDTLIAERVSEKDADIESIERGDCRADRSNGFNDIR